ncbi:MAG: hypothetical protein JNM93_08200 [Bacteriovoracaceae bacterium]|nr:hypothetical protein [Bacteriovoracaceae bacterium]
MSETRNNRKNMTPDFDLNTWKAKFQDLVQSAQDEIKKTTAIGKKMISASKSNSTLHDAYEKLGILVEKAIHNNEIKWEDPQVTEILEQIKNCKDELNRFEEEVRQIKTSPQD